VVVGIALVLAGAVTLVIRPAASKDFIDLELSLVVAKVHVKTASAGAFMITLGAVIAAFGFHELDKAGRVQKFGPSGWRERLSRHRVAALLATASCAFATAILLVMRDS
jgi:hypothetical protein